jgi:hypothetical protein
MRTLYTLGKPLLRNGFLGPPVRSNGFLGRFAFLAGSRWSETPYDTVMDVSAQNGSSECRYGTPGPTGPLTRTRTSFSVSSFLSFTCDTETLFCVIYSIVPMCLHISHLKQGLMRRDCPRAFVQGLPRSIPVEVRVGEWQAAYRRGVLSVSVERIPRTVCFVVINP